jgi:hypothetical protein
VCVPAEWHSRSSMISCGTQQSEQSRSAMVAYRAVTTSASSPTCHVLVDTECSFRCAPGSTRSEDVGRRLKKLDVGQCDAIRTLYMLSLRPNSYHTLCLDLGGYLDDPSLPVLMRDAVSPSNALVPSAVSTYSIDTYVLEHKVPPPLWNHLLCL